MCAFEAFHGLLKQSNVETAAGEVIFISPCFAPVTGVEVRRYLLAADDTDVLGEDGVHHLAVVHRRLALFFGAEVESNDVAHCGNPFVGPAGSGEGGVGWVGPWDQTHGVHDLEDILFDAIVLLCLAAHAIIVPSQIAHLHSVLLNGRFLKHFIKFLLVGPPQYLLLEWFVLA
jgi:hypothetical protein